MARSRTRTGLRLAAAAPSTALRRTAGDPRLVRVQASWAALMVASWTVTVTQSVVAFAEGGSAAVALAVLLRAVLGVLVGSLLGWLFELTAANVVSSAVEAVGLFAGPALAAVLLSLQCPAVAFG